MKYFSKYIFIFIITFSVISCNEFKLFEKELSRSKVQLAKLYSNYATVGYSNGLFYGKYNLEFSNGDTLKKRYIQKKESRLFICDTAGVIQKDFLLKTSNFYNNSFEVLPNNEFIFIDNATLYYSEGQTVKEVPIKISRGSYLKKIIALDNNKVVILRNNQNFLNVLDFKSNNILAEKKFDDGNLNGELFIDKVNKKLFYTTSANKGIVTIEQLDFNLNSINKFTINIEAPNLTSSSISIKHNNFKNENYFLINYYVNGTLLKLNDSKIASIVTIPFANSQFIQSNVTDKLGLVFYNNGVNNHLYFNDNLQTNFNNTLKVDNFDGIDFNNTYKYFDSQNGKKLGYLLLSTQSYYYKEKYKIAIRKRFFNETSTAEKTIFISDFFPTFSFQPF